MRRSSSYWEHLARLNERFKEAGKQPVKLDAAPEELEDEDLMEMINAGLSGIIVVDNYKAELWAKIFPNIVLHPEIIVNTGGEIGWMFRKDSPKLKAEVDAFAKKFGEGTAVGNTLIRRYVGSTKFVKNATSAKEMEKFEKLVGLFRKYADKYGFDWRLIAAQMYQESRFDPKAKSFAGAQGLLQVMPRTARFMGFKEIKKPEDGIHAGVKYLDWVRNRFEDTLPFSERMWFSLAAYNAGHGHVADARRLARQKGLDGDVWFGNTEKAMLLLSKKQYASKARYGYVRGIEPVSYVRQIRSRYRAYTEVAERRLSQSAADSDRPSRLAQGHGGR